jgi:hypothetical protein
VRVLVTSRRTRQGQLLGIGVAVVLCLSVFMQMLGVPAPLLNAGELFDVGEASVSEGFSLLTTCLHCAPSAAHRERIAYDESSLHVPILAASLFHPPLI